MSNAIDDLFASGAPSFFTRDTPVGSSISGPIISAAPMQSSDFATKKLETWDDGRPKMLLAVTVASNVRTTPDDNGHRTIYIKTWGDQSKAFKQAVQNGCGPTATASQALTAGNVFTATYTGEQPSDFGSPTKVYAYQIQQVNTAMDQAFAQPTPVAAPAPVQQFQQGPPPAWAGQPQATPAPVAAPAPQAVPQAVPAQPLPQAPVAAPAPVQSPAAAPAAADPAAIARQLIAIGQPDALIAQATGLAPEVITALRAA